MCREYSGEETISFPMDQRKLQGETTTSVLPILKATLVVFWNYRYRYLTNTFLDQIIWLWFFLTLGIFGCRRILQILKAFARKRRERRTKRESFPLQFKSDLRFLQQSYFKSFIIIFALKRRLFDIIRFTREGKEDTEVLFLPQFQMNLVLTKDF